MLRLGRDVVASIISAAREREANLLLLGWPGYTQSKGQAFGSIIDLMTTNPPCDLAVARLRRSGLPNRILVPIAGGPNARLAIELAITEADTIEQRTGTRPEVVALNILLSGDGDETYKPRRMALIEELESEKWPIELHIKPATDVVQGILDEAAHFDQVVIGASEERMLEQTLFGSIPQRVAEEALTTVIMVKRHDPVKFGLRRWLVRPRRVSKLS
jgi:CIC family chloride channel protein